MDEDSSHSCAMAATPALEDFPLLEDFPTLPDLVGWLDGAAEDDGTPVEVGPMLGWLDGAAEALGHSSGRDFSLVNLHSKVSLQHESIPEVILPKAMKRSDKLPA